MCMCRDWGTFIEKLYYLFGWTLMQYVWNKRFEIIASFALAMAVYRFNLLLRVSRLRCLSQSCEFMRWISSYFYVSYRGWWMKFHYRYTLSVLYQNAAPSTVERIWYTAGIVSECWSGLSRDTCVQFQAIWEHVDLDMKQMRCLCTF